ncbi:FAD-binding oxidoreductase [Nocardiopsis exhalans]|uniref:Decaprenylphospho-beta-D-ribofuranose 2-oxidase n=2 Tax=Nocardiopsis TaxID=2013 RepID=A0A840WH57_9ACTN|nr:MULTISPECIES: FAD-binding oxidoreductase [Nocardiopsis]MBB5495394.1 decaprenylphospho-beta-D-ribofuranose 2-oxidase [Nocardiopsis metallicus]QRN79026.1 MAG: FAD-binding oxidoreductase [Nocardiopsis sp. BM-2018]USY21452.1 FAD-binding oxidoreductase [Nocardiopsis exhalans]
MSRRTLLSGWGRTAPTVAHVTHPRSAEQVAEALSQAGPRGVLARGLGRSYGDAAQAAGGLVLDCTELTGRPRLDTERQEVTAPAGTSMERIIAHLLRRGHFVSVTPGTSHVTLGGAIAADVHGKNHHADSSIGAHVRSLTLITPDGRTRRLGPDHGDTELFWATVGGMGLTGVITEATVGVHPVETAYARVDTDRTRDLDSTLELMARTDHAYRYTVCWVDLLAKGASLGRGVLTRAHHARLTDLPLPQRRDPLRHRTATSMTVPPGVPSGMLNRYTVGAFNTAYYNAAPHRRRGQAQPIGGFLHPLDAVSGWNRVYGRSGFVQYQFVVPLGAEDTLRAVVEGLSRAGAPSFLAVLKRMGESTPGPLSFPRPGWTLALDLPADLPGLARLLNGFDERVIEAGGRLYLAKDSRARPETVHAMYPGLAAWRATRARADPDGVLISDLARRLELA